MIDTMTLRQILKQSDTFTCIIYLIVSKVARSRLQAGRAGEVELLHVFLYTEVPLIPALRTVIL